MLGMLLLSAILNPIDFRAYTVQKKSSNVLKLVKLATYNFHNDG